MKTNKIAFILNAHLPFVRHLDYERFLEEDWLYEAINESYLPLIRMLERISADGVAAKLTISLSPTLCAMFADTALQDRFIEYTKQHIELGLKEVERTKRENPEHHEMAVWYLDRYQKNLSDYEACGPDLLAKFRALEDSGVVELITTAATHCYLPLYQDYPAAINAQVELGVQSHLASFGRVSRGFWLPECGYFPSLEDYLKNRGIQWFQTASQSMLLSPDRVECGTFRPVRLPNGLVAFPRDYEATSMIWSNTAGYPCDRRYREFYRDIGYDLPMDYIGPYVEPTGNRVFTGYKYEAITGPGNEKVAYQLELGKELAKRHATNFLYNIAFRADKIAKTIGRTPFSTIGIDCELFGHWWFEGVEFLEQVLRQSAKDDCTVEMTTPTAFLEEKPELQTARPAYSSWGEGGFSSTWLDGTNSWIYRHIQIALERMEELADRFPQQSSLKKRFLNQAMREVMLAMASDWPFIMCQKTDAGYAQKRIESHLMNFNVVYSNMCKNAVNTEWLVKAEKRDTIFPMIDYNIFGSDNKD